MAFVTQRRIGGGQRHQAKERNDTISRAERLKIKMDRKTDKKVTRSLIAAIQKAEENKTINPTDAAIARIAVNSLSVKLHKRKLFTREQIKAQIDKAKKAGMTTEEIRSGIKTWTDFFLNH